MAEPIDALPKLRRVGRIQSKHEELFKRVSDGRIWKIERAEFDGQTIATFRTSLRAWLSNRGFNVQIRTDETGNVYVQAKVEGA